MSGDSQNGFDANSIKALLDSVYGTYILRDLLAKIVPGGLILYVALPAALDSKDVLPVPDIGPLGLVIKFSLCWLAGFALQTFGEITHLICYHRIGKHTVTAISQLPPKDAAFTASDWQKCHAALGSMSVGESRELERKIVIKEAAGNAFVALLLTATAIWLRSAIPAIQIFFHSPLRGHFIENFQLSFQFDPILGPKVILLLGFALLLGLTHYIHVRRQCEYIVLLLKNRNWTGQISNL